MMSKIKLLSIAVVGLLILNGCIIGFMFFRKPPRPMSRAMPSENGPKNIIIQKLHFDTQQINEYQKLIDAHQTALRELQQEMKENKNELYLTLNEENIIAKDSLENNIANIQKRIEEIHYQHFMAIKNLCKPDQLSYFNELTNDLAKYFTPEKNSPPPPRD